MNPNFEAAIERLYAAFARPTPAAVEGCPCCTTEEELRVLVETPLRELTADQFGWYGSKALTTVGNAEDFRYFWPRLVELAARGDLRADREVVFSKSQDGGVAFVAGGGADRHGALRGRAAGRFLRDGVRRVGAGQLGRLLEDLPPWLAPLLRDTPAAARNLPGLYSLNEPKLARGRLASPFWRDEPEAAAAVAAWLRSDEVAAALARFHASQDDTSANPSS
jgi:hypothetical protein